jgi:hypothetical protein
MSFGYHIPYALFLPTRNPDGSIAQGIDGNGNPQDGWAAPAFDTLIGVANDNLVPATFQVFCANQDGSLVKWADGQDHGVWTLQPGHSIANTFIAGNNWPTPPQDWRGYLEIACDSELAIHCLLGGGGLSPKYWNLYGAHVPIYASSICNQQTRILQKRSSFIFAYSIPIFADANHGPAAAAKLGLIDFAYRSGLVLTNFDYAASVMATVTFTVGDCYAAAGSKFSFKTALTPRQSTAVDVYTELLAAGYPAGANAEGFLKVTLDQAAWFVPYLVNQNAGYDSFAVGQACG